MEWIEEIISDGVECEKDIEDSLRGEKRELSFAEVIVDEVRSSFNVVLLEAVIDKWIPRELEKLAIASPNNLQNDYLFVFVAGKKEEDNRIKSSEVCYHSFLLISYPQSDE